MDLLKNHGMPAQVNKTAFEVGKNLGTSTGAVVFRNEVLELIQYAPTTQQVYSRPQLIVPPQINKFYIFDLSEGKSIVDYLVKNELQVFVVSWRNPTAAQSHWDLDTYVTRAGGSHCGGARDHRLRRRQPAWRLLGCDDHLGLARTSREQG